MTPEERAGAILRDYRHAAGHIIPQPLFLGRSIAAAIRAAIAEEREACAQTAEAAFGSGLSDRDDYWQPRIAAAIRARGENP
jgi:hypothetical protein